MTQGTLLDVLFTLYSFKSENCLLRVGEIRGFCYEIQIKTCVFCLSELKQWDE